MANHGGVNGQIMHLSRIDEQSSETIHRRKVRDNFRKPEDLSVDLGKAS